MADYPVDGASEDTWGALLIAFTKLFAVINGTRGGKLGLVSYENAAVFYENECVHSFDVNF